MKKVVIITGASRGFGELIAKKFQKENFQVIATIRNINSSPSLKKLENLDIDGFCHVNDLSYAAKPEDELNKYKKGDKLKVKVLEIKKGEQKVRVGLKQLSPDPIEFFKDKKVNDTITVKVISSLLGPST